MGKQIGLVGVGAMGSSLLERLFASRHTVKAFDIADTAMTKASNDGAQTVDCAASAAKDVDFVHVFVRTDQEMLDATLGPKGVLEGVSPGCPVILHSTILPDTTRQVASDAAKAGIDVMDASVTSVPRVLRAGGATFLVGGPDEVVAKVRPHLEALGKAVIHFGPVGAGNTAKIIKNYSNVVERVLMAETVALAQAGGLDVLQYLEMAQGVSSGNIIEKWEKALVVEDGTYGPKRAAGLFNKDIHHVAQLGDLLGLDLPLTRGAAKASKNYLEHWAKKDANKDAAE
ncbi:MAG: NAD(P)-dependent oxidoreductase [Rhodospirillales bacterium]|jgi:3-hydroxyisobutyrate dehydrogenase-like beta-hydroxyacid dehydrogenase|nr:NAD(P)-dependent oxidoreductase [Rhodospirillales bacterium]MBT4007641.1 NAD(P)-dependent oxidoreductase [Rhodospirillales bacterium]MBT5075955.1 NAD(P)-dependent oxidoreductase [Rhodospirillales bacterium]MBT5113002.1 NAD(P)-dependent oxidoreductase [Rhodospirillales bacterium]MBT5672878.1 NAD(P)-dependent oxidoreductase [Rhodospirillales bacterium]